MKKAIVVLCLLLTCFLVGYNTMQIKILKTDNYYMQKQIQSMTNYNKLLNWFNIKNKTDLYGGMYINEDKELVTLVTDDSSKYRSELKKVTQNQNLIIKKVKYSYNYLQQLMEKINEYFLANENSHDILYNNFNRAALYDDKNCIVVSFFKLDDESIKLFKNKISPSEAIKFEEDSSALVDENSSP